MNKIEMLLPLLAILLVTPASAQEQKTYVGASYELGNVKVGSHHANVDGFKFEGGSEYGWGGIKGTAATLTGEGAEYDNYSFSVEKTVPIMQSNFFVAPEVGVTYSRYDDGNIKGTDIGPMVGASLGYNINKQFQFVTHYNYAFGMKSSQPNINESSLSVGLKYRFNI